MLRPGMIISDRYEIIDSVGSGGMADVYKAKDQRLERFVAIKILKDEYSSDKIFVNKFRGEAQSAAGLSHPNIVNVYDVGDDKGLHYIVMELVEGITLKRFIEKKGKLEVKEAVGIAIQIAQGMEAAHDNHIIHRDIKPQNIIISRDGKVKVTDFGIAKASNSNTITSNAMGSVHYLSPEQARGGYSDEKSDIYSLGVTIYEMLSGKVPFAGDNNVSVAMLHIQGEAMTLRELDSNIPLSIDKIVQKCMQKKPERRYHSASDLIVDLKRALANPNGDFVQIPSFVASDSPTIKISDEDIGRINNGSLRQNDLIDDDDEELDSVDSRVEKIFSVVTIVAIVILAIIIMWVIARFVLPSGDRTEDKDPVVTMIPSPEPTKAPTPTIEPDPTIETYEFPTVIGHKKEDAIVAIKAQDPTAVIKEEETYSAEYEVGYVVRTYPLPNTDYRVGSNVIIYVSVGAEPVSIPYVYGNTWEQAEKKLRDDYDLVPERIDEFSSDVPAGDVIRTDPPKESMVKAGDKVKVYVSKGAEVVQTAVPYLIGETSERAKTLLSDAGLVLGNVSQAPSDTYAKGIVTYQDTTAGELVNRGTVINITESTGPESTETGGDNTDEDDTEDEVRYMGKVTISTPNPFDYIQTPDGTAEIILELEQDGYGTEIYYNESLTRNDFPLSVNVDSESDSIGAVKMYVDGEVFRLNPNDNPYVWIVEFEAVEE
ncbi:MAG: Stk1 family PASTA domain-containing Ser/Thr kinase [Clostridiales bacterium]|nr:Stk1 family PASTA domain-containing Ser/Thr kinase [Clostridiales bacterium]